MHLFDYRSTFPEPFEDEIHPRLRFAHRGLVAMANNGTKHSNDSQFIITLGACQYLAEPKNLRTDLYPTDRADELHGKHTLFGRCMGDTIYSMWMSPLCYLTGYLTSHPDVMKIGDMGMCNYSRREVGDVKLFARNRRK